ncbi:unnamed protein product [Clonostachys rosea]|uniref:Methyltransferase domain-containing protein n=1 Tax=Bionectria ochroleuca TaxID=29856 RepID=A0ABY6V552_BIOOC|nr:unnamed protein product [Clonostachys rosea]
MSSTEQIEEDYNKSAKSYNDARHVPSITLESQLINMALGDASGLVALDLGGGAGLHAREAIDLGASRVDIVDLSSEMLKVAQDVEDSIGRKDRIRCYEANVAKPMDHLPLDKGYDIVMANWVFDHASEIEILEGMWQNIARYLKPGGIFVGVRVADLHGPAASDAKYGVSMQNPKPITGGFTYTTIVHAANPWEFQGTSLDISCLGSFELHEKYGLEGIQIMPHEEAETVQKDPSFWELWRQRPVFSVVRGTKRV